MIYFTTLVYSRLHIWGRKLKRSNKRAIKVEINGNDNGNLQIMPTNELWMSITEDSVFVIVDVDLDIKLNIEFLHLIRIIKFIFMYAMFLSL